MGGDVGVLLETPSIDPEFAALIPPLKPEELQMLEENIVRDGCRDPLVTWNGVLVDGHNRLSICQRRGVPYSTVTIVFPERDDARLWIIRHQLARRNLTPFQSAELALKGEAIIAARARERQVANLKRGDERPVVQISSQRGATPEDRKTRTELARRAGVSHDTISKVKAIVAAAPEEMKAALRSGEISINAAHKALSQGVHYSSDTDQWSTPQDLFDVLNAEFKFTLDVCATHENAKCERHFTEEEDGLSQDWSGVCWMNPPYGDEIGAWMNKAFREAMKSDGPTVVCLVPARVDTEWWWSTCIHGEIRFMRGRLKFGGCPNSAPFPSAVIVFPVKANVKWWEWRISR